LLNGTFSFLTIVNKFCSHCKKTGHSRMLESKGAARK